MNTSADAPWVGLFRGVDASHVWRILGILLAYKIIYLAAVSAALWAWPERAHADMFHSANQVWMPDGHLAFDCHFASWDAEHYLDIAADGYEASSSRCAFYPLFPLMIRYFSIVTGGSGLLAGMILANAFSVTGWLLFYVLVRTRLGGPVATLSLILLVAFPGSLFFQFIYTESLFFLLLMLLLLGLDQDRFWLSVVTAFLLPLTRAVGLFCIFPLLWHVFLNSQGNRWLRISWLQSLKGTSRDNGGNLPKRSARQCGWLLAAPICGWVVYLTLMKFSTGNAFQGFVAQKQFGMESIRNIFNLPHFLEALFTSTSFASTRGSLMDRISFILLLYSLPLIWRLDKEWFLWAIFLGVVPAMSGMFVSYTRFASVVFPVFVAMALFLDRPGILFRCLRLGTIAAFLAAQVILLWRFVNFQWAG